MAKIASVSCAGTWIVTLVDGRELDLADKELDTLTEPRDVQVLKRYRNWAAANAVSTAAEPARRPRSGTPTPYHYFEKLFKGMF
jgi:hypothetical protein